MDLTLIELSEAQQIFKEKRALNIVVIGSDRRWYFRFDAFEGDELIRYVPERQRGSLRTWADLRIMLSLLHDWSVNSGQFEIEEEKK